MEAIAEPILGAWDLGDLKTQMALSSKNFLKQLKKV
jgi:hypothetical protein